MELHRTTSARLRAVLWRRFVALDMSSLRQILEAHESVLLLDAASARIQVGWLTRNSAARWQSSDAEAGIGVFDCVQQLAADPMSANAFVFCEGPGSILGIRTVAMALRTWRVLRQAPAYTYGSLALVSHALGQPGVGVIADARREAWHLYRSNTGLKRASVAELPEDLVMPEGFRHWSPLPPRVRMTPYDLADLLPRVGDVDLFRIVDAPDAFLHEEPSYVTWTPQIHRAPSSP